MMRVTRAMIENFQYMVNQYLGPVDGLLEYNGRPCSGLTSIQSNTRNNGLCSISWCQAPTGADIASGTSPLYPFEKGYPLGCKVRLCNGATTVGQ
jgi:hypothetical protein